MICKSCTTQMPDNAKFCPKCGQRSEVGETDRFQYKEPKTCPQCGTKNPPEAKFCKKDGFRLIETLAHPLDVLNVQSMPEPPTEQVKEITFDVVAPPSEKSTPIGIAEKKEEVSAGILLSTVESKMNDTEMVTTSKLADEKVTDHLEKISESVEDTGHKASQRKPGNFKPSKNQFVFAITFILLIVCVSGGFYWYFFMRDQTKLQQSMREVAPSTRATNAPVPPSERSQKPAQFKEQTPSPAISPSSGVPDAAKTEKTITVNPARVEDELNRSLRNQGIGSITAEVDQNIMVTLKGTVSDKKDRKKALSLARGMKGIRGIKDIIFVVGP